MKLWQFMILLGAIFAAPTASHLVAGIIIILCGITASVSILTDTKESEDD